MMGRWLAGLLALSTSAGCVGPEETRYLSCFTRPSDVEARSYDWHDPFPDESAGPGTFTRPRTFVEPRSDTRKTFDLSFLQAMHPSAGRPQLAGVPIVRGPAVPGPNGVPISTSSPVASYPYPTWPAPRMVSNPHLGASAPIVPAF